MRRALIALTGAAALALVGVPGIASAQEDDENGVDIAPLCSVLTEENVGNMLESGVIPPALLEGVPDDLQTDEVFAFLVRQKLQCGEDQEVTGAEANAALCDTVLTLEYIHGFIRDPLLDLNPGQVAAVTAQITQANVDEARDLFGCRAAVGAPAPDVDEDVDGKDKPDEVDEDKPDEVVDLNCDDLTREQAQEILDEDPTDPNGLDADSDDEAFEYEEEVVENFEEVPEVD